MTINHPSNGKKRVSGEALAEDIKRKMTDSELIDKYQLSSSDILKEFIDKLIEAHLLSKEDIEGRDGVIECHACGYTQEKRYSICPKCGILVYNFKKENESNASNFNKIEPLDEADLILSNSIPPVHKYISNTDKKNLGTIMTSKELREAKKRFAESLVDSFGCTCTYPDLQIREINRVRIELFKLWNQIRDKQFPELPMRNWQLLRIPIEREVLDRMILYPNFTPKKTPGFDFYPEGPGDFYYRSPIDLGYSSSPRSSSVAGRGSLSQKEFEIALNSSYILSRQNSEAALSSMCLRLMDQLQQSIIESYKGFQNNKSDINNYFDFIDRNFGYDTNLYMNTHSFGLLLKGETIKREIDYRKIYCHTKFSPGDFLSLSPTKLPRFQDKRAAKINGLNSEINRLLCLMRSMFEYSEKCPPCLQEQSVGVMNSLDTIQSVVNDILHRIVELMGERMPSKSQFEEGMVRKEW